MLARAMTPHASTAADPVTLFYSYAHEDEPLRDELQDHLAILERRGVIRSWHDRAIVPGHDWSQEIDQHLREADLVLLLISKDFIASDSVVQTQFLDLARDGVAADAQLRGLDAAAARDLERGVDQPASNCASARPRPRARRPPAAARLALQVASQGGHGCRRHRPVAAAADWRRHRRARPAPRLRRRGPTGAAGARAGGGHAGGGRAGPSVRAAGPWASTTCAGAITVSQWQMFSSWRTLPGKSKAAARSARRR
jgi:hypothetical protein